jgi:hypothetical protein
MVEKENEQKENFEDKNLRKSEPENDTLSSEEFLKSSQNTYFTNFSEQKNDEKLTFEDSMIKAYSMIKRGLPEDFDLLKASKMFWVVVIIWILFVGKINGLLKQVLFAILLTIMIYLTFYLFYKKGILKMKGGQENDDK